MRTCKKCGCSFSGDRCRPCANSSSRQFRLNNPEKARASSAAWRKNNPEAMLAARKRWSDANPEKLKLYAATRAEKHGDKQLAKVKAWAKENPEKYRKATIISNHNRRAKQKAAGGKLSRDLSSNLFQLQKGKCACCGKPLGANYHMDHIMPIALGGTNTDDNIQLLTRLCNIRKNAQHPVEFMQSLGYLI